MDEYKDLLHVDRTKMDVMLDTQPTRYMWAVEQSAEADAEVRRCTQKLEVVKSEVYSRLKSIIGPSGKLLSEAAVALMLPAEPEYELTYAELTESKKIAKLMNGVVDAFQQRKSMLVKAVEQEALQLCANPVTRGNYKHFEDEAEKVLERDMGGLRE